MRTYGLEPDFPAAARAQLAHLQPEPQNGLRDLRGLAWSSIDNDDSRDLDQIEVCSADAKSGVTVLVAIADVDGLVPRESPLDAHAATNTTSVYTPALIFPMLPPELSTDRTSLNEGEDRPAIVTQMTIDADGRVVGIRRLSRARAQSRASWPTTPSPRGSTERDRLRDAIGRGRRSRASAPPAGSARQPASGAARQRRSADFERVELKPVVDDHGVRDLGQRGAESRASR